MKHFKAFKEAYMNEVAEKNVTRRTHPENENIVVLKYSDRCVFNKNWNEVTKMCRNLVVDEEKEVILSRPFSKFFNHYERNNMGLELPSGELEITEKLDGIQANTFVLNGRVEFASDGHFDSNGAKEAKRLWEAWVAENKVPNDITLIVEVISPETKVVIDYKENEILVLVGVIDNKTGDDFSHEKLAEVAQEYGLPTPKKYELTLEEALSHIDTLPYNKEGYVVKSKQERMKIKSKNYLNVFRWTHLKSDMQKMEKWKSNEIDNLINDMPNEYKEHFIKRKEKWEEALNTIVNETDVIYEKAPKKSRKDFAIWVNKNNKEYAPILFKKWDKRLNKDVIKNYLYQKEKRS